MYVCYLLQCLAVYKSLAVTGSWDCSAMVWDIKSLKTLFSLTGHTEGSYGRLVTSH